MGLVFRAYPTDLAIRFAVSKLVEIEWSGLWIADSYADEMPLLVWWNASNRTLGMLSQVECALNRTSHGWKARTGDRLVVSVVEMPPPCWYYSFASRASGAPPRPPRLLFGHQTFERLSNAVGRQLFSQRQPPPDTA